ncbi:hypothetical protein [Cryobacterium soli]|uniref:hypothetical protein n=1 Tax=Cryobacterium soli TaxID=2220095 RepID=UPI000E76F1FF|nr:hypothetical protein [Cryobacterium soli]
MKTLRELTDALTHLQAHVGLINTDHGFREYSDTVTEPEQLVRSQANALMLIVGEVAEAHEELRKGKRADETYYPGAEDPETGLGRGQKPAKPEGVPSEIADVVIRCLDFADNFGFDLGAIVAEKILYNETRPFKHGKKF